MAVINGISFLSRVSRSTLPWAPATPQMTISQNTGPFSNIQPDMYWSATTFAPNTNGAWLFAMGDGSQGSDIKSVSWYGWAVQSGDVSAVPVPAAVWLLVQA